MASRARQDMEERTVVVDRLSLVENLEKNRKAHVEEYEAAVAGFKELVRQSIEDAFEEARNNLTKKYENWMNLLEQPDFADHLSSESIVDPIYLSLDEPESYEREYTVAVEMAKWDTRKELELTHAQFRCFVLDDWDWKSDFQNLTRMYNK